MNPPFRGEDEANGQGIMAWVRKSIEENRRGKTVVLLIPAQSTYVNLLREAGAEVRSMGRIAWLHSETREPSRSPRPITCFVLRGHTKPESVQPIITNPDSTAIEKCLLVERLREAEERLRAAEERWSQPIVEGEVGPTPTIGDATRDKLFKIAAPVFHPKSTGADVVNAQQAFHRLARGCSLDELADIRREAVDQHAKLSEVEMKIYKREAERAEAECEKLRAENQKLADKIKGLESAARTKRARA